MSFLISNLRERPEFCGAVADRVWRAWWKNSGCPLTYISGRVADNLKSESIPFALVAHDGNQFLGTTSVIWSDMDERPAYSPWVAAVWVEPESREQGIATALVTTAIQGVFDLGYPSAYLCAAKTMCGFYEKRGWIRLEDNVGVGQHSVLARRAA